MKNLIFFATIAAVLLLSCNSNEVNEPNAPAMQKISAQQLADEYVEDFDKVAFAVNQLFLKNDEFRYLVYQEADNGKNSNNHILIKPLVEDYGINGWFDDYELDIFKIIQKYPSINITIANYFNLDKNESLPVIYYPYIL